MSEKDKSKDKAPEQKSPPEVEVQPTLVEEGHFPEPSNDPDGSGD